MGTMTVDKNDSYNINAASVSDITSTPIYATFAPDTQRFYREWSKTPGSTWYETHTHTAMWPDFWTDARKKSSEKYYKHLKEEFYSGSGLPIITPTNAMDFIDRLSKASPELKPHFQEVMSGTSRLTSVGYREGLRVMPPLDYRYGWDLACLQHQRLASKLRKTLGVPVTYYCPTCRPWSSGRFAGPKKAPNSLLSFPLTKFGVELSPVLP